MAKEIFNFSLNLEALPVEPAIHEGIVEYPRVKSPGGIIRIIHTRNETEQQRAVDNFTHLKNIPEMLPVLPSFIRPITLLSAPLLVIDEFAPDDSYVAVRTLGANQNVYTGKTDILDEAEVYFRQHGQIGSTGYGIIPELAIQAQILERALSKHMLTARMSAFSVVVNRTNDQNQPFQATLKIRDLSQITRQAAKLAGYPIWGADCFWGMISTALWFHKTSPPYNTSL